MLGTQVWCILHNIILRYDGLDTIGNYVEDCGMDKDHDSSDDDIDTEDDAYMEGVGEDVEDATMPVEQEVQVGYAETKSRMWIHYKYACECKEVCCLKRATVYMSSILTSRPTRSTRAVETR